MPLKTMFSPKNSFRPVVQFLVCTYCDSTGYCPNCDGDGDCPYCEGDGCKRCGGAGACRTCGGEGYCPKCNEDELSDEWRYNNDG